MWKTHDGEEVSIDETDFAKIGEEIKSIIQTGKIASVSSSIEIGHEDVTLEISCKQSSDEPIREIEFGLQIENWGSHLGGSSHRSKRGLVEYTKTPESVEPAQKMRQNGSFYHKLERQVCKRIDRPSLEYSGTKKGKACFSAVVERPALELL